jgi:biopolymer transport protein ExbD
LIVTVDEGGRILISAGGAGEEAVADAEQLRARLEQLVRERRGRGLGGAVFVKTYPRVKYAEVVKIIEAARRAGADPVGLRLDEAR